VTGTLKAPDAPVVVDQGAPHSARWQWPVAAVVFVAVFALALPKFAAYDRVWSDVVAMDGEDVALLAAAATWNLVTYWFALMCALPGLSLGQAAVSNQASSALSNVVPGGAALGASLTWTMYTRWGFSKEAAARALALTSAWNNLFKFGLPLVALALASSTSADHNALSLAVAVAALGVFGLGAGSFVILLRSPAAATRAGAALGRVATAIRRDGVNRAAAWAARAESIRQDGVEVVARRWPALTAATIVSHLSLFAVLLVSVRAVGISADVLAWTSVLAAFAVVRVALVLPVTPGGAGMAELGLTGLLVAAGGPNAAVVAAVLVFRALTWLLPVGAGAVAYGVWLRQLARDRYRP
jgi:putative heme transporter